MSRRDESPVTRPGCAGCGSSHLDFVGAGADGHWLCALCETAHPGWIRRRLGPVDVVAAGVDERTPCGHAADVVIRVGTRKLAVELAVADLVLRAMVTAVPLTWACPGSARQVGVLRHDPAYGALFTDADEPSAGGATVTVRDPATGVTVDLVCGPGSVSWPAECTDIVVAAFRTPPGWQVRGLPDLTGQSAPRLDPDVRVDASLLPDLTRP